MAKSDRKETDHGWKRTQSRRGLPTHLKPLAAALLFGFAADTLASPPPWAPAHGWRAKNDPGYAGYHGYNVDRRGQDSGVMDGRCNRDAIGAAIGGGAGAVIGHRVDDGDPVAILIGATGGAVLGGLIGRQMDRNDQACMGHDLELVGLGHWEIHGLTKSRTIHQPTARRARPGRRSRRR